MLNDRMVAPLDTKHDLAIDEIDVSVIIPVTERPEPLVELVREYTAPLRAAGRRFEVLVVAHPFFGKVTAPLAELADAGTPLRVIESGRSVGETALLRIGLAEARGSTVLTLPAYRQVGAEVVGPLLAAVDAGTDFAVARRWPRRDAWVNRIQNWALHRLVGRLAGGQLHDVACGVRAARREVLQEIPLYGDFARFLPLVALHDGFRVREIESPQHPNDLHGRVYAPGIYVRRMVDLLGLFFLLHFTDKPLRFFGLGGAALGTLGTALLAVLFAQRIGGNPIAGRPLLLLSVLLLVLGIQAIALGLIGEMIVHFNAPFRRRYRVKR